MTAPSISKSSRSPCTVILMPRIDRSSATNRRVMRLTMRHGSRGRQIKIHTRTSAAAMKSSDQTESSVKNLTIRIAHIRRRKAEAFEIIAAHGENIEQQKKVRRAEL